MSGTRPDEWALWLGGALAFSPALIALAGVWGSVDYYQHGFLVPLVSAVAARQRTGGLGPSQRRTPLLAGLVLALGLYAAGLLLASPSLQGLALLAALCAGVGFRWGMAGLRALAFPLGFLVFMIPLPTAWVTPLVVALQQLASAAAGAVLQLLAVDVLREGNVMRLPGGGALFVAEACSGITSLLSLIPVGVLLARFSQPPGWRRWAVVLAVVPAALFSNAVRVILTVFAARAWGVERATSGALHDTAGLLTSAAAVLLVLLFGALLARGESRVQPA